jgi:Ca-activated chloride channel family protein
LAALRLRPEVIFLLTDGGDPVMKLDDLRVVREASRGRTSIHCLHFGRGKPEAGENFMQRLAAENRGSYAYIDMNAR